jgi:hypothetical protein
MTVTTIFHEQIQTLQQQVSLLSKEKISSDNNAAQRIELDMEINRIARTVFETPMPSEDRKAILTDLLHLRARLVRHSPVNGLKDLCLFLNLIQNVPPSPLCPAYNKMTFPTISTYHMIWWNRSCIRLDPKALEFVPRNVLEKAGPLEGKEVDLFWTAIDGYRTDRSLNNCTHPWSHRHALPGPEKIPGPGGEMNNPDSNVSFDVQMGLFPEIGFEKSEEPGAIAIDNISPMNVHVHAGRFLQKATSGDMLYSPDNAHFRAIPGSPFAIDWSVMQKDNRIAITKRLVIFDENHPICAPLFASVRNCSDLNTHLQYLSRVPAEIQKTFDPVIDLFESNHPDAMKAFKQMPDAFQYGIFKETWLSFDSPRGVHGDFGRASFEKDPSLDAKYHCDAHRCAEAIRRFSDRLKHLLVRSQFDLLFQSQSLVKGDNVLTMMKCAQLFYKDPKQGLAAFDQLTDQERNAVHFAFWELNKCPRITNFSTDRFPLDCNSTEAINLKVQAILLAASRQPHLFARPVIENSLLEVAKPPEVAPAVPSQDQVQQQLIELAFDSTFQSLENTAKAARVNQLLSALDKDLRGRIYGSVYANSRDPQKGGDAWGEKHVADDLEVLINSFQEVSENP